MLRGADSSGGLWQTGSYTRLERCQQLKAFLEAVQADEGLQEPLKGAADLDAAVAVAKEAGFDVSKADLLEYQAQQTLELSDVELEGVVGGVGGGPLNFGDMDPSSKASQFMPRP